MAKYRSRLEAVLFQLNNRVEAARAGLAEINRRVTEGEAGLARLRNDVKKSCQAMADPDSRGLLPGDLDEIYRYIRTLRKLETEGESALENLLIEHEREREALARAMKEHDVVQKIENRHFQAYLSRLEKKEQQMTDELAGQLKRGNR